MNAALVVMTILGCNDSGTDCHYIATAQERWPTVALCDTVSEEHLPSYANHPYPVIIAVCQDPQTAGLPQSGPVPSGRPSTDQSAQVAPTTEAAATKDQASETARAPEVTAEEAESLAGRAIERVRNVLPTTEGVKTLMNKPVRLVEDSYSWVAKKFER